MSENPVTKTTEEIEVIELSYSRKRGGKKATLLLEGEEDDVKKLLRDATILIGASSTTTTTTKAEAPPSTPPPPAGDTTNKTETGEAPPANKIGKDEEKKKLAENKQKAKEEKKEKKRKLRQERILQEWHSLNRKVLFIYTLCTSEDKTLSSLYNRTISAFGNHDNAADALEKAGVPVYRRNNKSGEHLHKKDDVSTNKDEVVVGDKPKEPSNIGDGESDKLLEDAKKNILTAVELEINDGNSDDDVNTELIVREHPDEFAELKKALGSDDKAIAFVDNAIHDEKTKAATKNKEDDSDPDEGDMDDEDNEENEE